MKTFEIDLIISKEGDRDERVEISQKAQGDDPQHALYNLLSGISSNIEYDEYFGWFKNWDTGNCYTIKGYREIKTGV